MKILHHTLPLIIFTLAPVAWLVDVDCIPSSPLAPFDDCIRVLDALDKRWRSAARENRSKDYGRTLKDTEGSVELPKAWKIDPVGHGQRIPKCQFVIDNQEGRYETKDTFRLQQAALAAKAVLDRCFPRGLTGRGFPTSQGNVFVELRYRPQPLSLVNGEDGVVEGLETEEYALVMGPLDERNETVSSLSVE